MSLLKARFEVFIQEKNFVHRGDTVLLAVSGGVDSMVMLHLFLGIRELWELKLGIVHVNHQLRGDESNEDEKFVRSHAQRFAVSFYSLRCNTTGYSGTRHLTKQEGARDLRYQFFGKIQRKTKANAVATAHQANDNAETVLMNILRGAGVRGLAGIPEKREYIIRPLLFAYRDDIERFARENSVQFRDDSSNRSLKYRRNLLRLEIIPRLQSQFGTGMVRSLNKVSDIMREVDTALQQKLEKRYPVLVKCANEVRIDATMLRLEPEFTQEEVILRIFRNLGIEPTEKKVLSALSLLQQPTGTRLNLGSQFTIFRDRQRLVLKRVTESPLEPSPVKVGSDYSFPAFRFSVSNPEAVPPSLSRKKKVEFVDADKLGKDLLLRGWKRGDWFIPLGLGHRKKLSDFLVDEKVPLFEKPAIPVLEAHGDIVWVCGKRLDDRFKVTKATRSVVRLTFSPLP